MRLRYPIFLAGIFILKQLNLIGQVKSNTVKEAILKADTVLLVSHNLTEQKIVEDKPGGGVRKSPPIVLGGRPNQKIIHETVLLNDVLKNQLISILTQPNNEGEINQIKCFLPHHSILLIKGGKTSYIEICFACQNLVASKGIGISDINYPKVLWTQLEAFFSSQGIKYQIPFDLDKE
jgi:hypothetical protein